MIYTHNLMKIFLDTADLEEIRAANETGLIDGVTTNPTLILRSGRTLPEVAQQLVEEFPILKVFLQRLLLTPLKK